jgi:hypothetical protein
MKHNSYIYITFFLIFLTNSYAQDRIFSFGYTTNFVAKDSTNFSLTVDVNRMPGKSEAAGTYFLYNQTAFEKVNFFIKPTADINLGTYTTLAANNVSVGLPIGISRLLNTPNPDNTKGNILASIEIGPDFIADKSFNNYLYYISPGLTFNYIFQSKKEFIFDLGFGIKYGIGQRVQTIEPKDNYTYNKYIVPIGIAISAFKSEKDFHYLKFGGIFKYNRVLEDQDNVRKSNIYTQLKLDIFAVSQLAFNITYTAGYEEPLFKQVNSLAFGITLARKG